MAKRTDHLRSRPELDDPSIGDVVDLVKTYAKQETIDPIKGAGKFLGFGVAGALAAAIGTSIVLLGLLRLLQTEVDRTATGSLSWLAYLIVLVAGLIVMALAYKTIVKPGSDKEKK